MGSDHLSFTFLVPAQAATSLNAKDSCGPGHGDQHKAPRMRACKQSSGYHGSEVLRMWRRPLLAVRMTPIGLREPQFPSMF